MSSAVNAERMPFQALLHIGTLAATTTLPGPYFRKKTRIKKIHITDQAGVAADNTNFLQLSLQKSDGTVLATYDTRAANQGALTALTPAELVFDATALALTVDNSGELEIPALTTTKLVVTKNGTGVPTLARLQFEAYTL